jgi:hypothetical protein
MGYETHAICGLQQQHPLEPNKPLALPHFIERQSRVKYSPEGRHLLSSGGHLDFSRYINAIARRGWVEQLPMDRCGKTNCSNNPRSSCVGIACPWQLPAILALQKTGL